MSIMQYFRREDVNKNGLPNLKGLLSRSISSLAIARANKEVEAVIHQQAATKKRGPYKR